jgi:hypothetical protein
MIEVLSVALSPGTDHGLNLAGSKTVGAKRPTLENLSSRSCRSERPDVAPPMDGKYNVHEPGALSITVRWTIVSPVFPIPTGRTSRPVLIPEAAGASLVAADCYRFQLLTGCRRGEIHGDKRYNYPPIRVGDVDCEAGKMVLRDAKNRSDHKLLLARQALEIAARHCAGRKSDDVLFPITDARKTLKWINAQAKNHVQGHGLRETFASIAEALVSGGLLKRMLNHSVAGDVILGHYVGKSEAQLRAGWQTVADFIEAAALEPTTQHEQVVAGFAPGKFGLACASMVELCIYYLIER